MKNILILILILSYQLSADELKWVDEQINAIKPARDGIQKSKINAIKSPFIFLIKKEKTKDTAPSKKASNITETSSNVLVKKEIILSLNAIINKSALINEKWYKIHEKVGKYTIISIERGLVILSFKKKKLILSIKTDNKNLKFKK